MKFFCDKEGDYYPIPNIESLTTNDNGDVFVVLKSGKRVSITQEWERTILFGPDVVVTPPSGWVFRRYDLHETSYPVMAVVYDGAGFVKEVYTSVGMWGGGDGRLDYVGE